LASTIPIIPTSTSTVPIIPISTSTIPINSTALTSESGSEHVDKKQKLNDGGFQVVYQNNNTILTPININNTMILTTTDLPISILAPPILIPPNPIPTHFLDHPPISTPPVPFIQVSTDCDFEWNFVPELAALSCKIDDNNALIYMKMDANEQFQSCGRRNMKLCNNLYILKTYSMPANIGKCIRCSEIDGIRRKTVHFCVQCSTEKQKMWFCYDCFTNVHSHPFVIKKPLFITTKPIYKQTPSYYHFQ